MISAQIAHKPGRTALLRTSAFTDDPQSCSSDLWSYLKNVLEKERQRIAEGETLKLTFQTIKEAPVWLFEAGEAVAKIYGGSSDQLMRIIHSYDFRCSDSVWALSYGSGDTDLDTRLSQVYQALQRVALATQDDSITDISNHISGYYPKPVTKYPNNRPSICIYTGDLDGLKTSARIAGDSHWSATFLSRICLALLDFDFTSVPGVEDGQKIHDHLKAHVERRRKFLMHRLYGLRSLVPKNDRYWCLEEIPDFLRRHPGALLGDIARHLGIDIGQKAEKRKLQRTLQGMVAAGRLRLAGKGYYLVELRLWVKSLSEEDAEAP